MLNCLTESLKATTLASENCTLHTLISAKTKTSSRSNPKDLAIVETVGVNDPSGRKKLCKTNSWDEFFILKASCLAVLGFPGHYSRLSLPVKKYKTGYFFLNFRHPIDVIAKCIEKRGPEYYLKVNRNLIIPIKNTRYHSL